MMTLCVAVFAQAQTIHVDHKFWDGYSLYTVKEIRMGKYIYMTTKQGDELTLEKVKEGEFKIIPSRQADECPFGAEYGWRVQFIRQDGESFLAVRKPNGRISLNADGTASWCMVGSLNYTAYTYRIEGNTICMKSKGVDSEEECYEYDSDTRTLKNEQGAVYYRQVAE